MAKQSATVPRPLVRANQSVIVLSVLVSWLLGAGRFYWILLIPLLSGLSGLIFGYHPVFKAARRFLRYSPASYVQEDAADQRFNQILACAMLGISFVSFLAGYPVVGYIFSAFVFAAALAALFGFCVGCHIRYQFLKWRAGRR